jgi:hypothetical protein
MGCLGPSALVAGIIAVAGCTPPEPPRDAGPPDTMVVDVPLEIIAASDVANDVAPLPAAPDCPPADCSDPAACCAPAR